MQSCRILNSYVSLTCFEYSLIMLFITVIASLQLTLDAGPLCRNLPKFVDHPRCRGA